MCVSGPAKTTLSIRAVNRIIHHRCSSNPGENGHSNPPPNFVGGLAAETALFKDGRRADRNANVVQCSGI